MRSWLSRRVPLGGPTLRPLGALVHRGVSSGDRRPLPRASHGIVGRGGAPTSGCRALCRSLIAAQLVILGAAAWAGDGTGRSGAPAGQAADDPERDVAAGLRNRLAAARADLEREGAARTDAELALMARERDLALERQRSALLDRQAETLRAENEALRAAAAQQAALHATREEIEWTEGLLAGIPRFTTLPVDLPLPRRAPAGKPTPPARTDQEAPRVVAVPSPPQARRPAPASAAPAAEPLAEPLAKPSAERRPPAARRFAQWAQRLRRRAFTLPETLRPLGP